MTTDFEIGSSALERRLLARPRSHLAAIAAIEVHPRRVLRLGDDTFDLAPFFPRADVRRGALPEPGKQAPWSWWPELVWCDHVLAGAATARVAILRANLAPGALVAAIDAHATLAGNHWLAEELGLTPDASVGAALATELVPIQSSLLPVENRWTALAWLGRVPGNMNGPLCEALDSNP